MSETDVWLNIIRPATEIEISRIESAKSLDEVNLYHCAAECLLSLIVDLGAYNKLWRYADKAGELCTELDKKMWKAIGTHRDWIIADINKRNALDCTRDKVKEKNSENRND